MIKLNGKSDPFGSVQITMQTKSGLTNQKLSQRIKNINFFMTLIFKWIPQSRSGEQM